MLSPDDFEDVMSVICNDDKTAALKKMYDGKGIVDSAFCKSLSENRFEFDVIREFMNSLLIIQADFILRIWVRCCPITYFDLKSLGLMSAVFDDINFFLDIYANCIDNQKNVRSAMKMRYTNKLNFNTQEKKKLTDLYFIEGCDFLFVKNSIISFYLIYYKKYKDFDEWHRQVRNVISKFMVILKPKLNLFFNSSYEQMPQRIAKLFLKRLYQILIYLSSEEKIFRINMKHDIREEKRSGTNTFNFCDSDYCRWLYNQKDNPFKEPFLPFLFAECNRTRKRNLEDLRALFSLGSFRNQSAFAKSLKLNLRHLTKNADLFFEDEEGFKQLCDIYHRGLLRFFWKYETVKKMKKDYVELSQFIKEEGTDELFQKDGDTVLINFSTLDKESWWVEKLLAFEYQPAHSADNYNKLIETLFDGRTTVKIGDKEVKARVVLLLIMFYYWIFISLEAENSEDICLWSRCIFHKELPVG